MQTLQKQNSSLSSTSYQKEKIRNQGKISYQEKLKETGLYPLKPNSIEVLQINLGKLCNQVCEHCHVDAGPDRTEVMTRGVLERCLLLAKEPTISTIDLTGGAPEMNPNFKWFVSELSKLGKKVIVRSNLTILTYKKYQELPLFFKEHGVEVISSLPCYSKENVDKQRGGGVFKKSIEALKKLNTLGFGKEDSDLQLNLVFNPGGASLPPDQNQLRQAYKKELFELFGITFNNLYVITNLPISRFLDFLVKKNKHEEYMSLLIESFNPSAAENVMCRNTISVGWDGELYDCDFNQMLDLGVASNIKNIKNIDSDELLKRNIVVGQHCFGCTAGAGSSCQGSLS